MYYKSLCKEKPVYKPAFERWNMYKSIWIKHWPEFEKIYTYRFEKLYGPLDEEKVDEVKELVQCGEFKNLIETGSIEELLSRKLHLESSDKIQHGPLTAESSVKTLCMFIALS